MKNMLFLTHQLPNPSISGGSIKTYKLIEYLSKKYDLSLAGFDKDNKFNRSSFLSKINLSNIYIEPLNIPRTPINLLKSYISGVPLTVYRNYSKRFHYHIKLVASSYCVLFIDSYLMFSYLPENFRGYVILHEHNNEFLLWDRYAKLEVNILKKILIFLEAKRIKEYLKKAFNIVNAVLAAPNDIQSFEEFGNVKAVFYPTFHLGDESLFELPDIEFEKTEKALLFIGTLSWEPNMDGLCWFIKKVWISLKKRQPCLKFYIVGHNPPKRLKRLCKGNKDIIICGYVEKLEYYYANSRIFVAPIRFGSGMKVKIINAMYRGIPVITTSIGAEGINVKDMIHISISNGADKMINDCERLLNEKAIWERLRDESRMFAKKYYTWDFVFQNLEKSLPNDQ